MNHQNSTMLQPDKSSTSSQLSFVPPSDEFLIDPLAPICLACPLAWCVGEKNPRCPWRQARAEATRQVTQAKQANYATMKDIAKKFGISYSVLHRRFHVYRDQFRDVVAYDKKRFLFPPAAQARLRELAALPLPAEGRLA